MDETIATSTSGCGFGIRPLTEDRHRCPRKGCDAITFDVKVSKPVGSRVAAGDLEPVMDLRSSISNTHDRPVHYGNRLLRALVPADMNRVSRVLVRRRFAARARAFASFG